jgi:hypothetical protein
VRAFTSLLLMCVACESGEFVFDELQPPEGESFDDCSFGGPSSRVAGARLDAERALWLVYMDGSAKSVHRFYDGDVDVEWATYGSQVKAAGGTVAAIGNRYVSGADLPADEQLHSELVVWNEDGTERFFASEPGVYASGVWVGEDGWVAFDRSFRDFNALNPRFDGLLVAPDGASFDVSEAWPIGPPVGGVVPACDDGCGWHGTSGWLGERSAADWTLVVADTIVQPTPAGLRLLTPEGARDVTIDDTLTSSPQTAGPWVLVSGEQTWRVDARTGAVAQVNDTPPAGSRQLDNDYCGQSGPILTSDGAVLVPGRDDAVARVFLEGDPLGRPATDVLQFRASGRGGAYVIRAESAANTYCPWPEYEEGPPTTLEGDSVQVVRPDGDMAHVLELDQPWQPVWLDETGGCVLWPSLEDEVTHTLDVSTGQLGELGQRLDVFFR